MQETPLKHTKLRGEAFKCESRAQCWEFLHKMFLFASRDHVFEFVKNFEAPHALGGFVDVLEMCENRIFDVFSPEKA